MTEILVLVPTKKHQDTDGFQDNRFRQSKEANGTTKYLVNLRI